MTERQNDRSVFSAAEGEFAVLSDFLEDGREPRFNLIAYCVQADLLLESFAAGYKVQNGLLQDACSGRPRFRDYSLDAHYLHGHDVHYPHGTG